MMIFRALARNRSKRCLLIAILFLLAGRVLAQASKPFIVWTQPIPITFPGEINGVQLNAIALSGPPVPVSLSSSYNIMGITTDGFQFAGGFDGSGWAYSETTLGAPVMWQGMTFPLGPANQLDVVTSTTIPLPAGSFAKLLLLGDIVNNILPPVAQFIVTYTDGTSTSFLQSMSDWVNPRNYPGESVVDCAATRHFFNGTNDANSACIYGYSLSLDPAKVVQSIALPQNRNVLILSAVLVPPVLPGSFVYTPSSGAVPLPGTTNLGTVFTPSNPQAYSAANASVPLVVNAPTTPITPTINWPPPQPIVYRTPLTARQLNASASTPVGPVIVPLSGDYRVNAFYPDGAMYHETGFDGTFIAFSANQLGASLKYATSTFPLGPAAVPNAATSSTISLPSGSYSQLYLIGAGANGSQLNQTFTVTYTDGTQTAAQLNLSSWTSSQFFSGETTVASTSYADVSNGSQAAGTYDLYGYTIALDPTRSVSTLTLPNNTNVVILAAGLDPNITFPIAGNYVYAPPSGTILPEGTNPLALAFSPSAAYFAAANATNSILVETPTLTITANDSSKVYGTVNPAFTGSITGALAPDSFSESFSTSATTQSPAGAYAIVPSASGTDASLYNQVVVDGTLTITRAPAAASVAAAVTAYQTQPVTLTATVASSTTGTPTGTVHFYSNQLALGAATLSGGSATFTSSLPLGTDAITVTYDGDNNFQPTASSSANITVSASDFVLSAPNGLSMTGILGQSPTIDIRLSPMHGVYAGNVVLSSSGELPPFATSAFSSAMVLQTAGTTDVTYTVNTRLLKTSNNFAPGPLFALSFLMLPLAALRRFRRSIKKQRFGAAALLATAVLFGSISGCGSGYHNATYPLVITAFDGTVQHTLSITLDIQAQ